MSETGRKEKAAVRWRTEEIPPPLPWLARTGNSPAARVPWFFRREYTDDGRLVITGEKVDRHEYFEADRSDGRLRLNLIPVNVTVAGESSDDESEEETENEEIVLSGCDSRSDTGSNRSDNADDSTAVTVAAAVEMVVCDGGPVITESCGGGKKCSGAFMLGVAVTAINPVHT